MFHGVSRCFKLQKRLHDKLPSKKSPALQSKMVRDQARAPWVTSRPLLEHIGTIGSAQGLRLHRIFQSNLGQWNVHELGLDQLRFLASRNIRNVSLEPGRGTLLRATQPGQVALHLPQDEAELFAENSGAVAYDKKWKLLGVTTQHTVHNVPFGYVKIAIENCYL